jgi:lipopolysaccharide transport system permease protein
MVRYRQTLIGATWAVLEPLLLMVLFTVFFGALGRFPADGVPYPIFFLTGLVLWEAVARIASEGSSSVVVNGALVSRVYFPRAYFPIATAISALVDLLIGLLVLGIFLVIFQVVPGWPILLAPLMVAIAVAAGLGVTFWLAAMNVAYRDIAQLTPIVVRVWFFSSPIMYSASLVPEQFQPLYYLNPVAVAITGLRWAVAGTPPPPPEAWILGPLMAALLLVSGYVFFRYREPTFSDTI